MEVLLLTETLMKKKVNYPYGCICPTCGSVFLFGQNDICNIETIERGLLLTKKRTTKYVYCPNNLRCNTRIPINSNAVKRFNDSMDEYEFRHLHDY